MNKQITKTSDWETRIKKNTIRLGFWTGAWTLTMALATFGPIFLWDFDKVFSVSAILLNLGIGIGMIIANKQHLRGLDELQQKIQLEAMALALGVGIVGGLSYSLLDITNVIAVDAEIAFLVMLMSITYIIALAIGKVRYK